MHVPNKVSDVEESITSTSTQVLLWLLRIYKLFFSQLFTGSCRFVPSCSTYAAEAVERHGAARGLWLTAQRLIRCQPLCQGGLDQVPMARTAPRAVTPPVGHLPGVGARRDLHDGPLEARGESAVLHRDRRDARLTRRDKGEYREYWTEEQRRQTGSIAGRMQRHFHQGLPG